MTHEYDMVFWFNYFACFETGSPEGPVSILKCQQQQHQILDPFTCFNLKLICLLSG